MSPEASLLDDEAARLWRWAYRGECFGEELFDGLADANEDSVLRDDLRVLARLEAEMSSVVRDMLISRRIVTNGEERSREAGRDAATAARRGSWHEFLALLGHATAPAIERYRRLEQLSSGRGRQVARLLIAHEEALHAFAEASSPTERADVRQRVANVRAALRDLQR